MTPSVDVFVPCYNYGRFLRAAVDSALSQRGVDVRVLIIDDASTDETPSIGDAISADHGNVTFLRHTKNAGHIATYNEGLGWARQTYFQFLSADDLLAPGALQRATAFMSAHPEVGLVYGRTFSFDGIPPVVSADAVYDAAVVDGLEFIRRAAANCHNPIANPSAVLVRTDAQHEIGGYLPELPHSGDMEMWLRFAAWGPIGVLDGYQGFYRRHATNMSRGYQNVRDYTQRLMAFEAVCRGRRAAEGLYADALAQARRAIASEAFWTASRAFECGDDVQIGDYLAFSATADPAWPQRSEWRNFRIKRAMGRRLSRLVTGLVSA
jgi:GT2 family glycosyltransferase